MEIHQLVVAASAGDAVTNAAFEMRRLLRRIGPSEIFARYLDPVLENDVLPLSEYDRCVSRSGRRNVLIYHASIGEPDVLAFLLDCSDRLVLVYHNITPAEYFAALDPAFARLLIAGRVELAVLRERVDLALAVSAYNAEELASLGYREVRVSPLVIDLDVLRGTDADASFASTLDKRCTGPRVLFVGQLMPHKRPDLLVQAYHVLVTYLMPEACLTLAGPGRLEPYRRAIENLVQELNLPRAAVAGRVTPAELAALYRGATVFVTASEHEGVCVPLLEAMAFDVPVIARNFGAIPETLGDAGLLLPAEDDPILMAETMARLLDDGRVRDDLISRGRRRLADFDPEMARTTFLSHLAEVV